MSRSDQSVCGFKSLWGKLGSTLQRKTGHLSAASVRGKFVLWEVSLLGRFKSESPEKDNSFLDFFFADLKDYFEVSC